MPPKVPLDLMDGSPVYPSITEFCRRTGCQKDMAWRAVDRGDFAYLRAVAAKAPLPVARGRAHAVKTKDGREFRTISEASKALGISMSTISTRAKRGDPIDEPREIGRRRRG
jgi:hypothetical protein